MIDPTAQYDYEERQNFLEAERAGKRTGIDDGPPNSIIKDRDWQHIRDDCERSLAAEREKNAELVEALNKISIESDCDDIIKISTDALAKNGDKP